MDENDKPLSNKNVLTKQQFMEYFSEVTLPSGVLSNYYKNQNYIEFIYNNTSYAVLIGNEEWEDIKQELFLLKERKLMASIQSHELEKQDTLTKLYNKEYSRRIIEDILNNSDADAYHALMLIDIDNFNIINESLGYLFGDTVLVNISDNLKKLFCDTHIVSRIGEDEFLIFIRNVNDKELLKARAQEIYSILHNTYTGDNSDFTMSCSIGIALYPSDGFNYNQLFTKADAALRYTQQNENSQFYFYDKNISEYSSNDSYNKYKITETRAYGTSNFDKDITAFAFDIMSRTKDVNSAINLLLNRVRIQFDLDHICIIENSMNASGFQITYLSSKVNGDLPETLIENKYIDISDNVEKFDEKGIFYIKDTSLLQPKNNRNTLKNRILKAVLQCAIFEDGIFKGCVSIDDFERPRYWTQYEVDSLVTITRIISSYLLKMRASERANQRLYQIVNYDSLTGLPTLHMFKKVVRKLLQDNPDETYAVIYSDISHFKYINDSFGYEVGDKILCDFAEYLSRMYMKNECLARCFDDNFLAVIRYEDETILKAHVLAINEQFNTIQKAKFPANKFIIKSGISIIDPNEDITVAIDNANVARKCVKDSLKTACKIFDASMKAKLQTETEITNNMEQALKNEEFVVYLQPKIGLSDNKIVGAEALVRWQKEDKSLILPNDFIPLFEKNGFIVYLDFYVYEQVCKKIRSWLDNGLRIVPISINVSRIHLNDEGFVEEIRKLVDRYNIPYYLLELELTESIFLNNTEVAISTMKNLRELGFVVSMDDFGAGYSSLNLLKQMSTDVIKLDKEFFGKGEMQKEEQIILSSIISMAKQLNMKVLSEGVETQKQSDFLKSVCCDMAQGFLYSKPISLLEFEKLILNQQEQIN